MFVTICHGANPGKTAPFVPGGLYNMSMIDDPHIDEWTNAVSEAYLDDTLRRQIIKDDVLWKLEQVILFPVPDPYTYIVWQPWVRDYHGESRVGYLGDKDYSEYIWIDQDLKQAMTGKR